MQTLFRTDRKQWLTPCISQNASANLGACNNFVSGVTMTVNKIEHHGITGVTPRFTEGSKLNSPGPLKRPGAGTGSEVLRPEESQRCAATARVVGFSALAEMVSAVLTFA